jgi:ribosomal protein S18 acetylase RimI-like enzyme
MTATIRKAEPRDLPTLGKLGAMLMRTHYAFDPQRFLPAGAGAEHGYGGFLGSLLDTDGNIIYVAEENGTVTGYVWAAMEPLSWKELRGPAGFIHDIVVIEEARNLGTGKRLMDAAVAWLRERKAPRVILWTAAPNDIARTLFHRLGFRETMVEMTMELSQVVL